MDAVVAVPLYEIVELFGAAGGGDDQVACVEDGGDQSAPEAARGAGDEPDLLPVLALFQAISETPLR
ncbi:hypothetical protein FHV95_14312 [Streptomyces coelicolor]|nr:hypothetical protein FHV91_13629 [Streptomyces coelicolor]TYP02132.1 hypothetical protein FHV98_13612 [Streptomyces coelicolor A3(2)]TYP19287.1 hypothetical protein FHV92_14412 [Streptomyces coelicolor]TYP20330.1 hypothetical protein FHV94_14412 [Streptomyces coelicolor]TYP39414.1 hypothetical protein FHV95_14312 [Streptomyces coelicolor]